MNRDQIQSEYWDSVAGKKEFTSELDIAAFKYYINQDSIILDYGCGYGRTLQELSREGYFHLYGSEVSKEMIKIAVQNSDKIIISELENQQTMFDDKYFDCALLLGVLTAITFDTLQEQTIREICRILKPQGYLFLTDFLLNEDKRNINRYRQFEEKYNRYGIFELEDCAVLRHHSLEYLKELLTDFNILHINLKPLRTMNGNISNSVSIIAQLK